MTAQLKALMIFLNILTLISWIIHLISINLAGIWQIGPVALYYSLSIIIVDIIYYLYFNKVLIWVILPLIIIILFIASLIAHRTIDRALETEAIVNLKLISSLEEEYKHDFGNYLSLQPNPIIMEQVNDSNIRIYGGKLLSYGNWKVINFKPSNLSCLMEMPEYYLFSRYRKGYINCDHILRFQYSVIINGQEFTAFAKNYSGGKRLNKIVTLNNKGKLERKEIIEYNGQTITVDAGARPK